MDYLLSFLVVGLCLAGMSLGLIFAKKILKKGCSLGPDCSCKKENTPPDQCPNPEK